MERGSRYVRAAPLSRMLTEVAARPHSSCKWCRAGWDLRGKMHSGANVGARGIARCTAVCASCKEPLLQGELYRLVNTPTGPAEVHDACMG